ncbi:MAG: acyl-protein synthase [Lentisphaerae bacterium]|nr:acyl-protein synthase [Lentisphaerota bacterium]
MISEPAGQVSETIPEAIQRFCTIPEAYAPDDVHEPLFIEAMRDVVALHIARSPWYRQFAQRHQIRPERLVSLADVLALPPVHANFFKFHEIRSIPLSQVAAHMTSSGTTGQKSQMFFDAFSIGHAREMVDHAMRARGLESPAPAHYLVNAYEPFEGIKVGTSNTNQYLMRYAPVAEQFWTLRHVGGGRHEFDAFGAIEHLEAWARGDVPVRVIGFPAFLHFLLERMRATAHDALRLPEGSWVVFGGGWKGHADKAIPKEKLYSDIGRQLGIPSERIIETYGSVEHCIPYVDCSAHHLHQPTWSRVVVRDLRTLAPVPDGTPGFLSFVSPYITSAPAHSIVMGDLAVRHPAHACPCGDHPTPWFEVLGRAGTSANKSCAAAAAELLGK